MAKAYKKRVLGRGLSAILNDDDNKRFENINNSSSLNEIEINKISLNPNQPRTNFDQKSLDQLASSISELGLIQPITVQQSSEEFILISGERGLRTLNPHATTEKPTQGNTGFYGGYKQDLLAFMREVIKTKKKFKKNVLFLSTNFPKTLFPIISKTFLNGFLSLK